LYPPQIQYRIDSPKIGIADIKDVMTVAAQKLIFPHGITYPIKATRIVKNRMILPVNHLPDNINDECKSRNKNPNFTSRIKVTMLLKASVSLVEKCITKSSPVVI
ncbi:hypothetical protein T4C_9977, partial [Trichinella pseudospiralis]